MNITLSRETMSEEVSIPALMPDINFKPQGKHALYSFQVVLGLVPDLFFSKHDYKPSHEQYVGKRGYVSAESPWFSCWSGSEGITLALKYDFVPPDDQFILMLAIGIRYGSPISESKVEQVKYAGAAKILKVA